MAFTQGNPFNTTSALEIVTSNFEHIQSGLEDVLLPEIKWMEILPQNSVDTTVNAGARSASYIVRDRRGKGDFRGRKGKDVPTVGIATDKVTVPIEASGVAANFDRADARSVSMGFDGVNLFTELGETMRESSERHIEGTFFYGFDELDYDGWLDYTGVPRADAANNAGNTSREWANKTTDEIIFDVQNAIATVWSTTRGVHIPGLVVLPFEQLSLISTVRASNAADKSLREYLETNNIYTTETGNPLRFMGLRYLDGAGSAGVDRMVVMEAEARNFWFPMPLPLDMLPPQEVGFGVDLLAEYVFGSFHVKFPQCMSYTDGI